MTERSPVSSTGRRIVATGIITAMACGVGLFIAVVRLTPEDSTGAPFVKLYDRPSTHLDVALVRGDGQFYAAIARDPTLSRPGELRVADPEGETVYRAQRPLFPYSAWLLSLGQPDLVPWAMGALVVIGAGMTGAGLGALLAARGSEPLLGVGVLVLPGAIWSVPGLTPELLALGFAAIGLAVLDRQRPRLVLGAVLLVLAVLTRETMLLVPVGLGAWALVHRDRDLVKVCVAPLVALIVAALAVSLRVGTLSAHGSERFSATPFSGLINGLPDAKQPAQVLLTVALVVVLVVVAIVRAPRDRLTWVAGAFLLLVPVYGFEAWSTRDSMARTMLPAVAFAAVIVVSYLRTPRELKVDA